MTFLELQKQILQSRKARKGVKNRIDYLADEPNADFYEKLYKKALTGANTIVKHAIEHGELKPFSIIWDKKSPEITNEADHYRQLYFEYKAYYQYWHQAIKEKNDLENTILELKDELRQVNFKLARAKKGGRYKDYAKIHQVVVYKQENPQASVRTIAKALGISTTTVQKALVEKGLNNKKEKDSKSINQDFEEDV